MLGEAADRKPALTEAMVEATLEAAGGNATAAADKLSVSRGKLLRFRKRAKKG